MHKLKVEQGDWIVVCDGTKALILENIGDEKFPNLQTKEVFEQENLKTREQGTDAPGRSIQSVGSARSAMEQTDWHDQAERAFLPISLDGSTQRLAPETPHVLSSWRRQRHSA
jgi:protein required for attachment to host cells